MSTPIKLPPPPTPQFIDIDVVQKQMTEEFTKRLAEATSAGRHYLSILLNPPMADAARAAGYDIKRTQDFDWKMKFREALAAGFKEYMVSWPIYITNPANTPEPTVAPTGAPASGPAASTQRTVDVLKGVPGSKRTLLSDPGITAITITDGTNRHDVPTIGALIHPGWLQAWLRKHFSDITFTGGYEELATLRTRLIAEAEARPAFHVAQPATPASQTPDESEGGAKAPAEPVGAPASGPAASPV
jgi:hypothetical protein